MQNGDILDEVSNKVGFRWFSFDSGKGFSLNGKPYKLRGVNRHQDQAPVGVAIDDEVNRRDIRQMKEIGCNFIRISHYPQMMLYWMHVMNWGYWLGKKFQ